MLETLTAADRAAICFVHKQWGPWKFQVNGLKNTSSDYLIHWDRIHDTGDVLDWIVHLNGKNLDLYGGESMVAHLVGALVEVLRLKSCGLLTSKKVTDLDAPMLAKAHRDKLKAAGLWHLST